MWKVKRMNTARIVVLAIAACAGLTALYLASGFNDAPAPVAQPVAQLPTVDILVAKSNIPLGQSVKPEDLQWQTEIAPETGAGGFILPNDRVDVLLTRRDKNPDRNQHDTSYSEIILINAVKLSTSDQLGQGPGVNVIRYGVASDAAAQK
jgi:Flp pilus assembly protein CpaB